MKKIIFTKIFSKNSKPILIGLVTAGLFSAVFYVIATTFHYLPIKMPAAVHFLVSDQTSSITNDGSLLDDTVVDDTPIDQSAPDANITGGDSARKLTQLDGAIKAAGIPIDGVALLHTDTHETRIDFKPEATEDQKNQARQIADSFDWNITAKDIFSSEKAKDAIIQQYSPEKLAVFSPYVSIINYYLDQKEFKKLKGFMNNLYTQNIITQDDYMVLSNILGDQKIYLNPKFGSVAQPIVTPSAPPASDSAPTTDTPTVVPDVPPADVPSVDAPPADTTPAVTPPDSSAPTTDAQPTSPPADVAPVTPEATP